MKTSDDSLLVSIQQSLLDSESTVAPILLSVRYLANRLGSDILKQWVRYESDGYPSEVDVPDYRTIDIAYKGHFSGPFGSSLKNAPIPNYLIEKLVGKQSVTMRVRQSIAEVDELVTRTKLKKRGTLVVPGANDLMLVLQGKVYPEYACNQVIGEVSVSALASIQSVVRSRLMDLTLEFENIAGASSITVGSNDQPGQTNQAGVVNNITNQVIYGNNYTVSTEGGPFSLHSINIPSGDKSALRAALIRLGLDENSASDLTNVIAEDNSTNSESLGSKTKEWISKNVADAVKGVITNIVVEFAQRFHGNL